MEPIFFPTAAALRHWLRTDGTAADELVVGFVRRVKAAGSITLTWAQAVDEALCVGWVAGVRHAIDETRYSIAFRPKGPTDRWTPMNLERLRSLATEQRLTRMGRAALDPLSMSAIQTPEPDRSNTANLTPGELHAFKMNKFGRAFFEAQPPEYRQRTLEWVTSAAQSVTRAQRLARVFNASTNRTLLDLRDASRAGQ